MSLGRPSLFCDYLAWTKVLLTGRQQSIEGLAALLACMQQALLRLPAPVADVAGDYLAQAVAQLPQMPTKLPTVLDHSAPYDDLATSYLKTLLGYDRYAASQLVMDALDSGVALQDIYLHVFQRSQYEIGRLWQINQLTVAQEHFCTAATQLIMSQLYPRIFATPKHGLNMVAASVSNDLHEMGTRMVADFFEMAGWDTVYLGANTPSASIVQTAIDRRASVLALSATIVTHVPAVAETIAAVRASVLGNQIKILVGGYAFNSLPDLWQELGADGTASNALETVDLAEQLVNHAKI